MQAIQRLTGENRRHAEPLPKPAEKRREEALAEPLTNREIEVLRLLALGKTNRQVAKELLISLSTVKTHIQHVNIKLGVLDRTQAAVRAVELGLLPKEE